MEKFYLDEYYSSSKGKNQNKSIADSIEFVKLCSRINIEFLKEWENKNENINYTLKIQKKAIIGYEKEVAYFKSKIKVLVKKLGASDTRYPKWYKSLADAIYHENWGLAGIAEWFSEDIINSSSAKVIGDRIYFLENGQMKLKEQKISKDRRQQLIRAFLLLTPEERLDKESHEIYMLDGTRVTIFGGSMVKDGQDVIVFRRYVIPNYSFEEQAARGTIPKAAIPLFTAMVNLGYNIAFTGAVRTAKTTFLSTWQSYENQFLEGVMVETDPEIPLHKIMKDAPIIQIIADNDKLKNISKNLLRSDADYFIMAEARDGIALDTALRIANKGTRRMKITFHTRDPYFFPYDVASEIVKSLGGDLNITAKRVASSFDYIFHFIQLKNKNQKRLKGIYELSLDIKKNEIIIKQICSYDVEKDDWSWKNHISNDKKIAGMEEDTQSYLKFSRILCDLEKNND
ncbi:P-loop NTPase family protein [Anaerovorax odorimutans]|uniref:hypothetical protein n=1 Tax=Anaerovorax odorimutans TaxID=109327 RepID=UPI0003FB92B3|nr:hypothetical protein [Anaerovorax odorimutans]